QFARIGSPNTLVQDINRRWHSATSITRQLLPSTPPPNTPPKSKTDTSLSHSISGGASEYRTILDEDFNPEQDLRETLEYFKSLPFYSRIPDIQDILRQMKQDEDANNQT